MSLQTWCETLVTAQVAGAALANTITATSLLPNQAVYTIPSNYFYAGRMLRLKASGKISNTGTPGITFDFRLGTLATPIVVFNGGQVTTLSGLTANSSWMVDMHMTCLSVGSGTSATIIGTGVFTGPVTGSTASAQQLTWLLPATSPAAGTGFDSTITNVANFFGTWTAASASNTITLTQYSLESMN